MNKISSKRRVGNVPPTDAAVLRHCGWFGHKYVVLQTLPDGKRCAAIECGTLERATAEADERRERSPAIYRQVRRGVWERV